MARGGVVCGVVEIQNGIEDKSWLDGRSVMVRHGGGNVAEVKSRELGDVDSAFSSADENMDEHNSEMVHFTEEVSSSNIQCRDGANFGGVAMLEYWIDHSRVK